MSPAFTIFLLLVAGIALLIAELFLPTHGVLGILGAVIMLIGVGYCFAENQFAGTVLFLSLATATPLIGSFVVKWWPTSPMGRKLVLQPVVQPPRDLLVQLGQTGKSLSALRPTGLCEFGTLRIEAQSELEMIEPGTTVKVVAVEGGKVTVRSV